MKIRQFIYYFIILIIVAGTSKLFSQPLALPESKTFFFDAVCFKSDIDSMGRVDVYAIVPNESLYFLKTENVFGAMYELLIDIRNEETGEKVQSKKIERNIVETDYFAAQGGSGKFDYTQNIFILPPGKYKVEASVNDIYSKKTFERSRTVTLIDFKKYPFSISAILLVSSIEEREGKFVITPHISDNVGDLKESFFIFFESYNFNNLDSVDFVYEIYDASNRLVTKSNKFRKSVIDTTKQHFIKIEMPKNEQGTYTLKLVGLKPSDSNGYTENDILALAERSIKLYKQTAGLIQQDITNAIKQLRYVASQTDLDFINSGLTLEEKEFRFFDFWKKLDPTPNTDKNEAFEEYYKRIAFANQNFRSYTEGWRTDKGNVYIVFGPPLNIEKTEPYADNRSYERWTYQDNKKFIFVDNSGFGDYRLYSPMAVTEKYKYQGN